MSERTSLELFPKNPFKYSRHLSIEFDLAFENGYNSYFGYILRMYNGDGINIDVIYEDLHDPLKENNLNIIIDKGQLLLSLPVPLEYLNSWKHVKIDFDILNRSYVLQIGDLHMEEKGDFLPLNGALSVVFGANHTPPYESSDLPNMKVRDITMIQDHKPSHHWPLNDLEGTVTIDDLKKKRAQVKNPYWLYQEHTTWELAHQIHLKGDAQFTYDQHDNRFFVLTSDSLISFTAGTGDNYKSIGFQSPINLLRGHHVLFDSIRRILLRYSIEQRLVVKYDIDENSWDRDIPEMKKLTGYWHHNKIILPQDTNLYLFGGYGHHAYKNSVFEIDLENDDWDTSNFDNAVFGPRYLAGLGANASLDTLYILGGYGSLLGEQKFDPHYWYELLRYIPSTKKIERLFTYDHSETKGFCFSNSIIIREDAYYALAFSKFDDNNTMQLIKGSLQTNKIEALGEMVPFIFQDINSFTTEAFVDLFYSEQDESMYAASSFLGKNNISDIKIYALKFPPKRILKEPTAEGKSGLAMVLWIGVPILLLVIALTLFVIRKKLFIKPLKKSTIHPGTDIAGDKNPEANHKTLKLSKSEEHSENLIARILLCGGFQVFDDRGKDITGQFTPTLKEMFLLIFLNSFGDKKGISSNDLRKVLWSDKNEKDARNNSSVNISRLKGIIAELGGSSISKETGYWKVYIDYSKVYVDYAYLYNVVRTSSSDQKMIFKLTDLVRHSPFLKHIDTEWLDPFKSEISNDIVDTLIKWAKTNAENSDPASIMSLADAVLEFDPVEEEAIELKCKSLVKMGKHSMAKSTYNDFTEDYKLIYGEEYKVAFKEIISH